MVLYVSTFFSHELYVYLLHLVSLYTGVTNHTKLYLFRKKNTRKSDSFDARDIFKQYGSEEWGDYIIREAHLSQRFVFDENGYYHCCASILFPENMLVD